AVTTVWNFDGAGTGKGCQSRMVQATNGYLYGTTEFGGANGYGAIYRLNTTSGDVIGAYHFTSTTGSNSYACLFEASDKLLYGVTRLGAANNCGALYSFNTTNNSVRLIHAFTNAGTGCGPWADLTQ